MKPATDREARLRIASYYLRSAHTELTKLPHETELDAIASSVSADLDRLDELAADEALRSAAKGRR